MRENIDAVGSAKIPIRARARISRCNNGAWAPAASASSATVRGPSASASARCSRAATQIARGFHDWKVTASVLTVTGSQCARFGWTCQASTFLRYTFIPATQHSHDQDRFDVVVTLVFPADVHRTAQRHMAPSVPNHPAEREPPSAHTITEFPTPGHQHGDRVSLHSGEQPLETGNEGQTPPPVPACCFPNHATSTRRSQRPVMPST